MTAEQVRHARDLLTRPDNTVSSIARLLGVSRATIYKYVPEVTTGRAAALPPGQKQRPGLPGARLLTQAGRASCAAAAAVMGCSPGRREWS
jgi:transposase-like protein